MGTGFEFIRDGDWERPEVGGISTSFCLLSPCRSGELLYPVKNSSKICFSFILLFPKDFKSGGSQEDAHMALSLLGRFPLKYLYTFLRRDTSWRVLRDALGKYFLTYWTFPSPYGKLYLDLIIYTALRTENWREFSRAPKRKKKKNCWWDGIEISILGLQIVLD